MVGIVDSGVGGLSVYSELKKLAPTLPVVYLSDQLNFPFGEKTEAELLGVMVAAVTLLKRYDVTTVVIACNSATVSTIDTLRSLYPELVFIGIEPAVKVAVSESRSGRVGVLATKRTVRTHESKVTASNVVVFKHHSGELIAKIENRLDQVTDNDLTQAVRPLLDKKVDIIVLGCTHFYFVKDRFFSLFPQLAIIEPSAAVAKRTLELLDGKIGTGKDIFLTSGDTSKFRKFVEQNITKEKIDVRRA